MKKHKRIQRCGQVMLLLMTAHAGLTVADETAPPEGIENSIESMGLTLDPSLIEPGIDWREYLPAQIEEHDVGPFQAYLDQINHQQNINLDELAVLNHDELIELSYLYRNQGTLVLAETEAFRPFLTDEFIQSNQCDTFIPAMFHALASVAETHDVYALKEEINQVLIHGSEDVSQIETDLGADWSLESEPWDAAESTNAVTGADKLPVDGRGLEQVMGDMAPASTTNLAAKGLMPKTPIPDWTKAFISEAEPMGRKVFSQTNCDRFAAQGINTNAWLKYTKHSEFTIHYKFCGEHALSLDRKEFVVTNKQVTDKFYSMPDNTIVRLDECNGYSATCAPMYVQMIAADILYERRIFSGQGYQLPDHWNVYIKEGPQEPRSSAFLNNINLTQPAHHRLGLRDLIFHEYFHAIETVYGSEWSYLENGFATGQWGGRSIGFVPASSWWSQLESMASWASVTLKDRYPLYAIRNRIDDARNHLFKSVYHPLEFGFLAERYAANGNDQPSTCLGCDVIKTYLEILRDDGLWTQSYLALHNFLLQATGQASIQNSLAKFLQDYHLELMFSVMDKKWATTSPNFRFLNRFLASTVVKEWPPRIQSAPHEMNWGFGACNTTDRLTRANASWVNGRLVAGFTCDVKMSPTGAFYFKIPLQNGQLPDQIMIGGVGVKVHPDDVNADFPATAQANFRTLPGELINGQLRIFAVPTELSPMDSKDFADNTALSLYGNMANQKSYVINTANHPNMNHVYLAVDYPFMSYEWWRALAGQDPQRENFMARVIVVGYWN